VINATQKTSHTNEFIWSVNTASTGGAMLSVPP
jgi:hypothetical protein